MSTKKQKQKEIQREQQRRIREAAMALHEACMEIGCQNCGYNNYDGKGIANYPHLIKRILNIDHQIGTI